VAKYGLNNRRIVILKSHRRALVVLAALLGFGLSSPAHANEWKMSPLTEAVDILPEARELQDTDRREFLCMALNIYHEARGESSVGQRAVAHVVLNRSKSSFFPNTLCEVIWQRSQFSWTIRPVGSLVPREAASWGRAQSVALQVMASDPDPTNGAIYFSVGRTAGRGKPTRIGNHVFSG
jgi:N-acetylmuramoyl-L-alanine amidase